MKSFIVFGWFNILNRIFLANYVCGQEGEKVLSCYFTSSSYLREGMPFVPSHIDPLLCTHIIYSSLGMREENHNLYSRNPQLDLGPGEIEPFPDDSENAVGELDLIRKTVMVREKNPGLKILISVGGLEQSSSSFSNMVRHIANRTLFIGSLIPFIEKYELDGVDLYWAYPGSNGGRPGEDKETFVTLMRELRTAFNNLTLTTGREYFLTAALGCREEIIDVGYNMTQLSEYVDFFHLFCFDYKVSGPGVELIYHHSPLHAKEEDSSENKKLTVEAGINRFLEMTFPFEKLIMGLSTHSWTYEIDPEYTDFHQFCIGPGPPGKYTVKEGYFSFFEICEQFLNGTDGWQFKYDHTYKVPYMHNHEFWIGYDNEISAKEKVDYAISKGFGGAFISDLDLDDYNNLCQGWRPYPFTSAIKERLQKKLKK